MKYMTSLALILIATLVSSCVGSSKEVENASFAQLFSFDSNFIVPIDTPASFVKNYEGEDNVLFAFVGKKVSVEPLPSKWLSMDACFKARYAIQQKVYGQFQEDTIEFVVFDHYGIPAFSMFENVLLFVSAENGTYYHQKYMYNEVYRTKDGRWAGPYAKEDYQHSNNKNTPIKPIPIDFMEEVSHPLGDDIQFQVKHFYPKPYYKVEGKKVIAVYGNYVEELFALKRDGFLTARGLF